MTAPAVVAVTSDTWTSVGTATYAIQAVEMSTSEEINPIYVTISSTAPDPVTDTGVIVYPPNDIRAPNYPFSCPAGKTLYVRATSSEGAAFIAIPLSAGGLISGSGLPALGQTTMSGGLPVTLGSDQSVIPVKPLGASAYNTAANTAGHLVKNGAGVWHGITINTAGLTSSATFYDGTTTGGTKLATITTLSQNYLVYDIAFTTGLFVVLAGGTPADVTISYF